MSGRCTGHCCRRFFLGVSLDELRAELERVDRGESSRYNPTELRIVVPMLVLLEENVDPDEVDNFVKHDPPRERAVSRGYWYTCRHLNVMTGDCTNYEGRPNMCRDYPYGGACNYAECTWDDGKNPPIPESCLVTKMKANKLQAELDAALKEAQCPAIEAPTQ